MQLPPNAGARFLAVVGWKDSPRVEHPGTVCTEDLVHTVSTEFFSPAGHPGTHTAYMAAFPCIKICTDLGSRSILSQAP